MRLPSGAGLLSLYWLVQGYGGEITGADVWDAYRVTLAAAERHGSSTEVKERVRRLVAAEHVGGVVTKVLGRELGLRESALRALVSKRSAFAPRGHGSNYRMGGAAESAAPDGRKTQ